MRYEDWDVLLFPTGKETKVPIKEFKVACHVVHDTELSHTNQSPGIPTISMHSWKPPTVSQFTSSRTSFLDSVLFQARLYIDGRLMASTAFDCKSNWPHVLAHSFEFSRNGDLETLKFPYFRQELLQQDHWSPADDLGRIKIVISEGFPRDSYTLPFERFKNIVAFSFQHAPLDILENSGIAWPNQIMWQRVPHTVSKPVPSLTANDRDSHAHSPRRHTRQNDSSGYAMPIFQNTKATKPSSNPSGNPQLTSGAPNFGLFADFPSENILGVDPYLHWGGQMGTEPGYIQAVAWAKQAATRKDRKSNTDISMPDYVSLGGHKSHKPDPGFGSFSIHEDDDASMEPMGVMQAPMDTPASGQTMSFGSGKTIFPLFANNGSMPTDLAETLTTSLLNQPAPANGIHYPAGGVPAKEIKSRKENKQEAQGIVSPSIRTGSFFRQDLPATRQVSHRKRVPTAASLPPGTLLSGANSPQLFENKQGVAADTSRTSSINDLSATLTGESTSDDVLRAVSGNTDKGHKKTKNSMAISSKIIDEADEPSLESPQIRLSPFEDTQDDYLK